ncbi:hypothetical protein ACFE04_003306 [Oxalis oulophora]
MSFLCRRLSRRTPTASLSPQVPHRRSWSVIVPVHQFPLSFPSNDISPLVGSLKSFVVLSRRLLSLHPSVVLSRRLSLSASSSRFSTSDLFVFFGFTTYDDGMSTSLEACVVYGVCCDVLAWPG